MSFTIQDKMILHHLHIELVPTTGMLEIISIVPEMGGDHQ